MRYVVGDAGDEYDARLRALIGYFTERRFSRGHPVLGIESDDGRLVAAANIDPPRGLLAPPSLERTYARLCETLGPAAMDRYQAFVDASSPFERDDPHYHLGMIGVIREERGRGYARALLEGVHAMSYAVPGSAGVSLTTETPGNLPFYARFGYQVTGRGETPDGGLVTWTLFRPRSSHTNGTDACENSSSNSRYST
jgi:GNAT superfamily N-acetyltransferase